MKRFASLLGTVALVGTAFGGTNLLENPSFEELRSPLQGGGFVAWETFNNFGPDESVDIAPQTGMVSAKSFGGFFGPGIQSDSGGFQTIDMPDAAGKTFRASVSVYTPAGDSIEPLNFDDPDGNFGHLPLLLLQYLDANGATINQPEVTVFEPGVDPVDTWVEASVEGEAPAGTVQISVFCLLIQFGNNPGALFWDDASLIEVEDMDPGCNAADLAEPYDILDLNDINTFVAGFTGQDPVSDIDENGIFDLNDITGFIDAFSTGCP